MIKIEIGPTTGAVDIAVALIKIIIGVEPGAGESPEAFLATLENRFPDRLNRFREAGVLMHKLLVATVNVALAANGILPHEGFDAPLRGASARRRSPRRPPRH